MLLLRPQMFRFARLLGKSDCRKGEKSEQRTDGGGTQETLGLHPQVSRSDPILGECGEGNMSQQRWERSGRETRGRPTAISEPGFADFCASRARLRGVRHPW